MRKLFVLVLLFVAFSVSQAQDFSIYDVGVTTLIGGDTITDTEDGDTTLIFYIPQKEPWAYSLHVIASNLSGTTDIDMTYEWSNDGTNFVQHTADSLASGNLQYMLEDLTGFGARYMRVSWDGVGTQSSILKAYLYVFKVPK